MFAGANPAYASTGSQLIAREEHRAPTPAGAGRKEGIMPNQSTAQAGTTPTGGDQNPAAGDSGKTFTQEEVNGLLAKQKRDVQAKYQDYDKYKAAYEEAQAKADADKSELQKALDAQAEAEARATALQAEKDQAAWIAAASKATGVPAAALHGSTEDEVNACAESLKEYFAKPAAPIVQTGNPSTDDKPSTGDPLRDAIFGNN